MRRIFLIVLVLVMTGCTTDGVYDSGKTWTLVGAVAAGGIIASQGSSGSGNDDCWYRSASNNPTGGGVNSHYLCK